MFEWCGRCSCCVCVIVSSCLRACLFTRRRGLTFHFCPRPSSSTWSMDQAVNLSTQGTTPWRSPCPDAHSTSATTSRVSSPKEWALHGLAQAAGAGHFGSTFTSERSLSNAWVCSPQKPRRACWRKKSPSRTVVPDVCARRFDAPLGAVQSGKQDRQTDKNMYIYFW